jgi:hypothetical protein
VKKYLFLILFLSTTLFSQDPWWWYYYGNQRTTAVVTPIAESLIPIGSIDLSVFPPKPYGDLYLSVEGTQPIRYWDLYKSLSLIMNSTTPSFEIGFDVFMNIASNQTAINIFGRHYVSGITNFYCYTIYDSLYLKIRDTTWTVGLYSTPSSWHSFVFAYDSSTNALSFDVDGTPLFSRVTTFKDTVGAYDTINALVFGGSGLNYNSYPVEFTVNENFHGGIDNVYIILEGDTVSKSNFNDGGTIQPINKFWYWRNTRSQDSHGHVLFDMGSWLGFHVESYGGDAIVAQFKTRDSGLRKDTCKYYPIPETDTAGVRGVRLWDGNGNYARATANKVIPNPYNPTEVIIAGAWTGQDSVNATGLDCIFLYRNDSLIGLGGGINVSFVFNAVWGNDSIIYVTYSTSYAGDDSVYSPDIVSCNVHTGQWDTLGATANYPAVSLMQSIKMFHDTLWVFKSTSGMDYLYAYDPSNTTWAVTDSFVTTNPPLPRGVIADLWQMGEDSLFVAVSGKGIYQINGGRKTLVDSIPNPYDLVPWYSSNCYDSVTGRIYWGGINIHDSGQCQGLAYYKDGAVTYIATVDSNYIGGMQPAVFGVTMWQNTVIAVGQFKIVDGDTIANVFMWDETRGSQPLDYAPEWNSFGVCAYETKDGYTDLLIAGDWVAAGGVRFNHIAGRYSEEHFKKVNPRVDRVTNLSDSIYKASYPPAAYTYDAYSPSRRAITTLTKFKIGVNGSWTNVTPTKTDSLLDANLRGYWSYTYSAALTGDTSTVDAGDTVYYCENVIDDYSNDTTTTARTMRIIADPTEVTTGLSYRWNYDTLTVTPVTNWVDDINGLTLTQSEVPEKPTLSSGVLFDTTHNLMASSPDTTLLSHDWTVVIVMKVVDTNTASEQFVFESWTNTTVRTNVLAFKIQNHATTTSAKFGVGYYNGAVNTYRCYLTSVGNSVGAWSVFIITADSLNKQNFYVNGVQGVNQGALFGIDNTWQGIRLGNMLNGGSNGMKNSSIRIVKIFPRVLSAEELTQEANYQINNNCQ